MHHVRGHIGRWQRRLSQHRLFAELQPGREAAHAMHLVSACAYWFTTLRDLIAMNTRAIRDPEAVDLLDTRARADHGPLLDELGTIESEQQWDLAWLLSQAQSTLRMEALGLAADSLRIEDDRVRLAFVDALAGTLEVSRVLLAGHVRPLDDGPAEMPRRADRLVLPDQVLRDAMAMVDRAFSATMGVADALLPDVARGPVASDWPTEASLRRVRAVPVVRADRQTFVEVAVARLGEVSAAIDDGETGETARHLVQMALAPWGDRPVTGVARWPSWASDDYSPVELSLAFRGAATALRVGFDPPGEVPTIDAQWRAGRAWMGRLEAELGVSCDRLRRVEDLFRPSLGDALFGMGFGFQVEGSRVGHRVYLNARAHGDGAAPATVRKALDALGVGGAWSVISELALRRPDDRLLFFALDLGDGPARVKVYVAHPDATAEDIDRVLAGAPGHRQGIGATFCRELIGNDGPYCGLPIVTYLAFTEGASTPSSATLQIRIRSYAAHDRQALDQVARLLAPASARVLSRAVAALAGRPLDQRVGLIACASYSPSNRPTDLTVYLATEMYEVCVPEPNEPGPR